MRLGTGAHLVEGGVAVGAIVRTAAAARVLLHLPLSVLTPRLIVFKLVDHRLHHHHHDGLQGVHHVLIPSNPMDTQ